MKFDFAVVWEYLPLLVTKGLSVTLSFIVICMVIGLLWGFLLSLARTSQNMFLYWASTIYVEFFRGTPVLVQLFWIFFCLPLLFGTDFSAFTSSVIALSLYSGAITSESFPPLNPWPPCGAPRPPPPIRAPRPGARRPCLRPLPCPADRRRRHR